MNQNLTGVDESRWEKEILDRKLIKWSIGSNVYNDGGEELYFNDKDVL